MSVVQPWSETEQADAAQIYHAKLAGLSFDEISDRFHITADKAIDLYRQRVVQAGKLFGGSDRKLVKQIELDRLDALQAPYWLAATSGDIKAGEFVLKVIALRMKLENLDQSVVDSSSEMSRVLIVGGSQAEFLEALRQGKNQHVAGSSPEDGDDQEEV